jgi:tetratricopeptide (TPR) repeat protein
MLAYVVFFLLLQVQAAGPLTQAREALGRNDLSKAETILTEALSATPESAQAHHLMGLVRLAAFQPEQARPWFEKALQLDPSLVESALALGDLHEAAGRRQEAALLYAQAFAKAPGDPNVLLRMGTMEALAGRLPTALRHLEAVPESRRTAEHWEALGRTYLSLDRPSEAENAYVQVLKEDSLSVSTLRTLSGIALKRGDSGRAWEYAAQARRAAPSSPQVLFDYAQVSMVHDLIAEAINTLQLLLFMEPENPDYLFALGTASLRNVTFREAAGYFQRYLKLRPDDPPGEYWLGFSLYTNNEPEQAERHLKRALELDPSLINSYYYLGMIEFARGNDEAASTHFQEALKASPQDHGLARFGMGRVLAKQGRLQEAAEHFQKAAAALRNDPDVHFQLSRVYARLGRRDEATRELEIYSRLKREVSEQEERSRRSLFTPEPKQSPESP